jgi:hypothetical protein
MTRAWPGAVEGGLCVSQDGAVNRTEIKLLGMSRSGNHAIINWIWQQAEGRKLFLNCAEGKTNPFETCRPLGDGRPWQANFPLNLDAERAGRLTPKDLLLHSYEDSFLGHAFCRKAEEATPGWVGPSARRIGVIVLRDPFNLFASRRKAGTGLSARTAVMMWKQHARAALGLARTPMPDTAAVLYNRWVADRAYRRGLAARLGLAFTDAGLEEVPECHGGSSFDGTAYDGAASGMDLFGRWRLYAQDTDYRALFDADLVALSRRLFGPLPAEPALGLAPPQAAAAE